MDSSSWIHPLHMTYSYFVFIFMLWYTASHLWSYPGSPVLIDSEILTMVVSSNKAKSPLGFFEISWWHNDKGLSPDELEKWQYLLGEISSWNIVMQCFCFHFNRKSLDVCKLVLRVESTIINGLCVVIFFTVNQIILTWQLGINFDLFKEKDDYTPCM